MDYTSTLDYLFNKLPIYQRKGTIAYKADIGNIVEATKQLNNPHNKLHAPNAINSWLESNRVLLLPIFATVFAMDIDSTYPTNATAIAGPIKFTTSSAYNGYPTFSAYDEGHIIVGKHSL